MGSGDLCGGADGGGGWRGSETGVLPCGCFGGEWAVESGYSGDGVAACGVGVWKWRTGLGVVKVVVGWWKCCGVGKGGEEVGFGKMCVLVIGRMFGWSRGWLVASEKVR